MKIFLTLSLLQILPSNKLLVNIKQGFLTFNTNIQVILLKKKDICISIQVCKYKTVNYKILLIIFIDTDLNLLYPLLEM